MQNKTNYENYLENQMKDPEFAALYALSREKVRIEIELERIREKVNQDADKKIVIRGLNKLSRYVRHIAL